MYMGNLGSLPLKSETSLTIRGIRVAEILAKIFEMGTSEGSVEIDTLEERVDFGGCLSRR